jgi:hypothetical protein
MCENRWVVADEKGFVYMCVVNAWQAWRRTWGWRAWWRRRTSPTLVFTSGEFSSFLILMY